MAEISAQLVKELRERTGAGMMECKKALVATNGDLAEAEVYLRKQGTIGATKKESRSTKQGLIASHVSFDGRLGVLVEVNCESDFVARTEDFQSMTTDVAEHIAETKPKAVRLEDVTEAERANIQEHHTLYEQKFNKGDHATVGEYVRSKIAKLGENIRVSRFVLYEIDGQGWIGSYIHTGSQIGVLLQLKFESADTGHNAEFQALVRDIAMQVAAIPSQFVSRDEVSPDVLSKEREIQRARALGEGKPEKMVDKIVEGRLSKFYEEVCLLEQPFIRENSVTVTELIKSVSAKLKDTVSVVRFTRYKVGDAGDAQGVEATPIPVTA